MHEIYKLMMHVHSIHMDYIASMFAHCKWTTEFHTAMELEQVMLGLKLGFDLNNVISFVSTVSFWTEIGEEYVQKI